MAADNIGRALHLCGRDHIEVAHPEVRLTRRLVYVAEAVDALPPQALQAIADGALVLIHSPRSARLFARLADQAGLQRERIALAAISEAAAAAAGPGWKSKAIAGAPSDHALLEVAAQLCQTGGEEMGRAE
jgi:uroporphyrinogen-III synthase